MKDCGIKNLYLFQANNTALTVGDIAVYWLPYSIACVWSYVKNIPEISENYNLVELGFKREKIDSVIQRMHLNPPDVVGLSFYTWNTEYSHALARQVKQTWPECVIVAGGPNVTTQWPVMYSYIDIVVSGEGEENFYDILLDIRHNKSLKKVYSRKRIQDLDIPSPFLEGIFEQYCMDPNPEYFWMATFETNRGCPYECTFCDWGAATHNKVKRIPLERLEKEIQWFHDKKILVIYGADANWGILKRDVEIAKLLRKAKDANPYLHAVTLQYAKNSNSRVFEIAKILDSDSGVTVSLQSGNPETCEIVKRKNMDVDNLQEMMQLSVEHGIATYSELILGLPKETLDTFCDGLCYILECGQHIRFNVLILEFLPNSELASWESRLEYGYKTYVTEDNLFDFNNGGMISEEIMQRENLETLYEKAEIVSATNTMSSQDIAEAFAYYVMMYNFHSVGYSRLLAKYARFCGVSYRTFYDAVWQKIQQHPEFSIFFDDVVQDALMHIGAIPSTHRVHILLIRDIVTQHLSKNTDQLWEMLKLVCVETNTYNSETFKLQQAAMYEQFNPDTQYNLPFDCISALPQQEKPQHIRYKLVNNFVKNLRADYKQTARFNEPVRVNHES